MQIWPSVHQGNCLCLGEGTKDTCFNSLACLTIWIFICRFNCFQFSIKKSKPLFLIQTCFLQRGRHTQLPEGGHKLHISPLYNNQPAKYHTMPALEQKHICSHRGDLAAQAWTRSISQQLGAVPPPSGRYTQAACMGSIAMTTNLNVRARARPHCWVQMSVCRPLLISSCLCLTTSMLKKNPVTTYQCQQNSTKTSCNSLRSAQEHWHEAGSLWLMQSARGCLSFQRFRGIISNHLGNLVQCEKLLLARSCSITAAFIYPTCTQMCNNP